MAQSLPTTRPAKNYNYYRDLDPATGRYVESDPIGLDGGVNTYVYAESQPLLFADPLGLCAISPTNKRCLENVFGSPVDAVRVRNKKLMRNNFVTTRKNEIRLPPSFTCAQFQSYPLLMLHEYYHVLRQWNLGRLSRKSYVSEWMKNGSGDGNKYEDEANAFARDNYDAFVKCTEEKPCIESPQ